MTIIYRQRRVLSQLIIIMDNLEHKVDATLET